MRCDGTSENLCLVETNKKRIGEEITAGVVDVKTFPYDIQFSSEHRCNLRCIMCWSTVARNQGIVPLMDRRLTNNTLERFRKLEPYIPYFQSLSLTGSGEPLLSPVFPEMLQILGDHTTPSSRSIGLGVVFNTHAQICDREMASLLVRSGVQEIVISMDGACKETYERIRVHAKWEKLLRTIKFLNEAKEEQGSVKPYISFAINCMRQNIEELPALIDFARAHGGHRVLGTNTIIYDKEMQQEALVYHSDLTRTMVIETIGRAKRHGIHFDNRVLELAEDARGPQKGVQAINLHPALRQFGQLLRRWGWRGTGFVVFLAGIYERTIGMSRTPADELERASCLAKGTAPETAPTPAMSDENISNSVQVIQCSNPESGRADILKACRMPWSGLMVESDGNVKVCCYTSPYVGNLNDQTFEEIWNGSPIQALRRSFLEGRPPEGCRNCFIFTKNQPREDVFVQLIPTQSS